jgi:hypothetical protein
MSCALHPPHVCKATISTCDNSLTADVFGHSCLQLCQHTLPACIMLAQCIACALTLHMLPMCPLFRPLPRLPQPCRTAVPLLLPPRTSSGPRRSWWACRQRASAAGRWLRSQHLHSLSSSSSSRRRCLVTSGQGRQLDSQGPTAQDQVGVGLCAQAPLCERSRLLCARNAAFFCKVQLTTSSV